MSNNLQVLTIGDPHFRIKYIKVIDDFISQTIELIKTKSPDLVVVLGDTLHHHEQAQETCHSRAIEWFNEIAKYTTLVILIGNHDRPNNSHFLTTNHFFNGLKGHKNIKIVDVVKNIKISKNDHIYRFVFVPYVPPGRFDEALNTLDIPIKGENVIIPSAIFAHQEFKGVKMGAIVSEKGDVWEKDAPLVISGHVHEYQMPQDNMIYVGTPYQTTYAEANNKGVFIFTFSKNNVEAKRIKLKLRVKQSIKLSPKELENWKIPDGDIDLRVIITGKQEEVEAVKQTAIYASMKKHKWIKVVLRPILDLKFDSKHKDQTYLEVLYDEISENEDLKLLYTEFLNDIQ